MSHWPKRADAPINRQIVLDLGSTKREIVAAMEALPPQFDPLGGHPMCGKETSGMAHADPEIYHSATFAFTPLTRTSPQGRAFAEMLATAVGAKPLWIDAQTHDRWVATTSHLPYLLASSLAGATPKEVAPLIGPGYRSASRLAAASPSIMLDILQTNRQPVLEALRCFRSQIERVEALLAEPDFTALSDLLMTTAQHHANLMQSAQES
jgi:prephenate dehydrogenase